MPLYAHMVSHVPGLPCAGTTVPYASWFMHIPLATRCIIRTPAPTPCNSRITLCNRMHILRKRTPGTRITRSLSELCIGCGLENVPVLCAAITLRTDRPTHPPINQHTHQTTKQTTKLTDTRTTEPTNRHTRHTNTPSHQHATQPSVPGREPIKKHTRTGRGVDQVV